LPTKRAARLATAVAGRGFLRAEIRARGDLKGASLVKSFSVVKQEPKWVPGQNHPRRACNTRRLQTRELHVRRERLRLVFLLVEMQAKYPGAARRRATHRVATKNVEDRINR
jgi:hypothetical protein